MVTRAARAARALSSAGTKGLAAATTIATTGAVRTGAPEKRGLQKQQGQMEKSREDAYDGDSASSSELSSLSSQSEFELSEEEEATASKYFQSPPTKAGPEVKKRKRAATVKRGAIKREPTPSLGDIVPAIIKYEKKKSVGKGGSSKAKNTPLKTEPPPHWEEMYDAVKEMRSRIPAPVDTMGCERLADGASTPKIRRFQTLISLMLSSQTKDTVNAIAMKQLQTELPGGLCLESILEVEPKKLDELIRVVGFHNRKTEYIKKAAVILRDKFDGEIPSTLDGLTSLPGVGPKMAHLCMSAAWNNTQGIGVDVHVHRIANMWGWVKTTTPEGTREALEAWLPRDRWREINHMLVGFGQSVCLPRGRKCGECSLADTGWCRAAWVGVPKAKRKVVVVKDEGGIIEDINHGEVKMEGEDFEVKFKTEGEGRAKREVKTGKGKKVMVVKDERGLIKEIKHETDAAGEGGVIVKTELDSPSTRSPVTRKRRRIKVEVKEEEDDDAVIADIEDIIPNLKSPR